MGEEGTGKHLTEEAGMPLYKQLYEELKREITMGNYRPGAKLPSEGELCKEYNVSRITVRNAFQNLVDEKLVVKYHGKGTFVALPDQVDSMDSGNSFTKSCLLMNMVPSTKVVTMTLQEAGGWIAKKLGVKEKDRIICIRRVRMVDGLPAIWELDYFRKEFLFLLEEDVENESLIHVIKMKAGITCKIYENIFDVHEAGREAAKYLDCDPAFPLLRVRQQVYGEEHRMIYYNEQYIRSDRYKYATRADM